MVRSLICINLTYRENYHEKSSQTLTVETAVMTLTVDHVNLTWHDHIKAISNKVSKSIGLLLKIRKYVQNDVLLTLYHTLIEPYFS